MRLPLLATLIALVAIAQPVAAQDGPVTPRLTVTGEGEASAVPDMATVTLGVTAQNEDAGAAMEETNRVAAAILARLDALEIAATDRQTSDLNLMPIWSQTREPGDLRVITGYEASNRLTVRVRDLGKLGDVLGAVLQDGANRLSGLSFGLQNPGPVMDRARQDAVRDAMDKARVLTQAAGITLGRVISMSEGGGGYRPEPMMEMARVGSVPVAAGESVLSANVTMVFELE